MNESFFVVPQTEPSAILLVDASYSVKTPSRYPQSKPTANPPTIFDEMQKICSNLPHKNFYLLFWNSKNFENTFGMAVNDQASIRGISKLPEPVAKENLAQKFKFTMNSIVPCCVTEPHLGFSNIDDWLAKGYSQTIYFLTDGFIGWNEIKSYEIAAQNNLLCDSIKRIIAKYPRVQINIIAVEAKTMNLDAEQLQMVGNDVFNAISRNNLTNSLTTYDTFMNTGETAWF